MGPWGSNRRERYVTASGSVTHKMSRVGMSEEVRSVP